MEINSMTLDRALSNAIISTEMEGFVITDEHRSLIEKILPGEISINEALKQLNQKYR